MRKGCSSSQFRVVLIFSGFGRQWHRAMQHHGKVRGHKLRDVHTVLARDSDQTVTFFNLHKFEKFRTEKAKMTQKNKIQEYTTVRSPRKLQLNVPPPMHLKVPSRGACGVFAFVPAQQRQRLGGS
jgi:hypothetical protein